MLRKFSLGLCAGILISCGGGVFLACENKVVGAVFFSVALVCICMLGYNLYTGKICYITENFNKDGISLLILCLLGNIVATIACGLAIRYALPNIGEAAEAVCNGKLANQSWWQTLVRGIFCGALVYLSVEIYKKKNTPIGILLCIPTFILSGYEHSIADMFYFGAAGIFSFKAVLFITLVVIGNSIGGLLLPLLEKIGAKKNA